MFEITLHLKEIQAAAILLTRTNIKDAEEATYWLGRQWLHSFPGHQAPTFLIGELAGSSVTTVRVITNDGNAEKSKLDIFVHRIKMASQKTDEATQVQRPFTLTIQIDEDVIRRAATNAIRTAFSSERYESGEGTKAVIAQVNKYVREADFMPIIQKLAPAIIKEKVAETLEETIKAALRKELKTMRTNGELAAFFNPNTVAGQAGMIDLDDTKGAQP